MQRADRDVGVYLHFPWCRRLCPYCDFPVVIATEPPHRAYLDAIVAELATRAPDFAGQPLATIYLGGGTPSWWDPACVAELLDAIRAAFPTARPPAEVTIEANPVDCTPARMAAWRAAGITRLSIGVQSYADDELAALGRDHRMGDGPAAIAAARAAGFAALSADLILGAPGVAPPADPDAAPASVHAAAASGVDHLSVYELTIEERTAFGQRARAGRLPVLGDDALTALYLATHHALTAAGFEHYEISSYARPGRRAIHNARYWSGGDYLGLGVGAASFRRTPTGSERWTNARTLADWRDPARRVGERTTQDADELRRDLLWLAMRTSDGAPLADLPPAVVAWATAQGLATADPATGRLRPTLRGFLFSDQLAAKLAHG